MKDSRIDPLLFNWRTLLAVVLLFSISSCDNCKDVECANGGTCVDGDCECVGDWTGSDCTVYTGETGDLIFWTDHFGQFGDFGVSISGMNIQGEKFAWITTATNTPPSCGDVGFANFPDLVPGTYEYSVASAYINGPYWSSTVTIDPNICDRVELVW